MKYFLSILLLIFSMIIRIPAIAQQALSATEFSRSIRQPDVQVLDVRTAAEYGSGHLDSVLLADWTDRNEFIKRVGSLDKSKPLYVYCLSGGRSSQASEWLQQNGFTTYTLTGGINAWKKEGLPVAAEVKVPQVSIDAFMHTLPDNITTLVQVGADWCPPCRKMKPVIDSLVLTDARSFRLFYINGAQQTELSKGLKVEGFPTFIVFKNGKEIWRREGIVTPEEIKAQF